MVIGEFFAEGCGIGTQGELIPLIIADPYFGNMLRLESGGVELGGVAEFVAALHHEFGQSLFQRAVWFAVIPFLEKVICRLGNRHEEGPQILGKRAQQRFCAVCQVGGDVPTGQPVRKLCQLVDMNAEGHAVICRTGSVVIIDGVLLPLDLDFIRVQVGRGIVLPGVHAVSVGNKEQLRIVGFRFFPPVAEGFFAVDLCGDALVEEAVHALRAPDEVMAA